MQVRDRQGDSDYTPGKQRWQVRWRDADGRQRKKNFTFKAEANGFVTQLAGKRRLRDQSRTVVEQWEVYRASRATTSAGHQANLAGTWTNHVEPEWGDTRLADVRHGDVLVWAAQLQLEHSARVAQRSVEMLSRLCALAARDDVLDRNPCEGVTVRVRPQHGPAFLTRRNSTRWPRRWAPTPWWCACWG